MLPALKGGVVLVKREGGGPVPVTLVGQHALTLLRKNCKMVVMRITRGE